MSTEDQTELSPDSQVKLIKEYAKKNDVIVPEEFIFHDDGISGRTTSKRPGFNKMIGTAKLKPRPFDEILVWKFSRFARNREDSIVYKSMLRKLGIEVISISEPTGDDKMSVLIEALIEAMDEYYSINLAEEVRRGMTEKFSRGKKVTCPPLGYIMKNGDFIPDEQTAPIVNDIFDMFVNQNMGYVNIAKVLNDRNIKTRYGNNFENRTVQYILGNPVYVGKQRWTPGGDGSRTHYKNNQNVMIVDSQHSPIIDEDTFRKAQEKMIYIKSKYKKHERTDKTKHSFMLRGIIKCSNCGSNLTVNASGTSLQCYKYSHGKCRISHSITIEKINQLIIDDMQAMIDSNTFDNVNIELKHENTDESLKKFQIQLDKENVKLKRVKEAYENGVDTLEEYKDNKSKIMTDIINIQKEIERLRSNNNNFEHTDIIKNFQANAFSILDFIKRNDTEQEEKNKMLGSIISKAVFDRPESSITLYYTFYI